MSGTGRAALAPVLGPVEGGGREGVEERGGVSALQGSRLIKRHFLSCTRSCRAQNAESIPGYSWGGVNEGKLKRRKGGGRQRLCVFVCVEGEGWGRGGERD